MPRRLLIADATATNRIALKASLGAARYDVHAVASGAEAIEALRSPRLGDPGRPAFDLVLADANLPDMNGAEFCRAIGAGGDATAPVLLLTEEVDDAARLDALRAGAEDLLPRPLARPRLLAHLRNLMRAQADRAELRRRDATATQLGFAEAPTGFAVRGRVVLISGHARTPVLAQALRSNLVNDVRVLPAAEAMALGDLPSETMAPDVFVLPLTEGEDEEDLSLISELRSRPATRHAAILALHQGARDGDSSTRALDMGANDLAALSSSAEELALRVGRQMTRKRNSDRLRRTVDAGLQMAAIDPLTGLFNRRYVLHQIADLAQQPRSSGRALGLMIVDIDHFKSVNDTYGHAAGDAVLIELSHRLRDNLRGADMVARLGGEEFVIVLPHTDAEEALGAAERLRALIAAHPARLPNGRTLAVSVSIGAALGHGTDFDHETVMEVADQALYAAKHAGRNRVHLVADAFAAAQASLPKPASGTVRRPAEAWRDEPCLARPAAANAPSASAATPPGIAAAQTPFRSR